jgi:hypothetical protein
VEDNSPDATTKNDEGLTKDGAIPREHPGEFYDGPGDHDHHPVETTPTPAVSDAPVVAEASEPMGNNSEMEVVNQEDNNELMNLETVE